MKKEFNVLAKLIAKANAVMEKDKAAKLSTKKRNKLKKSTFCGPGRSFPVNDCAHYSAALRLLNRSKFSDSTKKKIRSCINRKGKQLKCGGAKKANASLKEAGLNIEDIIMLPVFKCTRDVVNDSIENPGKY